MIVNVSPPIREGLVKQMTDAGCDSTIARETIDLAAHAIDSAIDTVMTVCRRGSVPQVVMSAHPLALALLATVAKIHAEASQEAAIRQGKAIGIKSVFVAPPETV